jgi:hypothetical protein
MRRLSPRPAGGVEAQRAALSLGRRGCARGHQNDFIERFNRTYRDEVLDADVFASPAWASSLPAAFRPPPAGRHARSTRSVALPEGAFDLPGEDQARRLARKRAKRIQGSADLLWGRASPEASTNALRKVRDELTSRGSQAASENVAGANRRLDVDAARLKRECHPEQARARNPVRGYRPRLLAADDAEPQKGSNGPLRSLAGEFLQLILTNDSRTIVGPGLVQALPEA